jgi:tetratricopeptide (TPR) repeat protein
MGTEVRKKALIIGISEYDNSRLPNLHFCKGDACKIYQLLRSRECGYEIPENRKLIGSIKYVDVRDSLDDFFNPKNSGPGDTLIFYFSGHGLIDDWSNHYISTSETDPDNPRKRSIPLQELANMMDPLMFVKIVIILDCCYGADPSIANKVNNARSAKNIILNTKINIDKGKYIFSACQAYQKSTGSDETGSIFTIYLCKGLMGADGESVDGDGNVTLYELEQYIKKQINSLKPRLKQTPLIAKIGSGDNDNKGKDVVLVKTQYIKPLLSSSGDLKQVQSDKELLDYYRIDQRIINIREPELSDLEQRIQKWDTSTNKANKPILIITGAPGTGKSWLAYRLVDSLKTNGHKVYGIIGSNIKQDIIYLDKGQDRKEKNERCPVYILDDRGISVGEVSTAVNTQKIYEILQSFLPTNFKETYKGPIIISIRKETWDYIINGGDTGKPLNESRLDEIVDKVTLEPLQPTEGEKLARSFYEEVDGKKPPYPNLVVSEEVKNMIIKRSNCNPIIIRLFFHEMYSRGNSYEITISDVEGIISSARHYCLKLIFNFYLNNLVDKGKVANTFAFLYLLAKEGAISLGHFTQIKENENYIPRNYLSRNIWKYLNLLNEKRPLPLFNIDDYGIMMPFHDSVSDAIINLVEKPGILKKEILSKIKEEDDEGQKKDLSDISNKLSTIVNVDRDIRINRSGIQYRGGIKEKAENELLDKYDNSIKDSIIYYFDSWNIEMEDENYELISDDIAYYLLSLIIEVLNPKKKFQFDSIDYINKLKRNLEEARLEYGNAANDIIKQLFWISENQYWLSHPTDGFKDIYIRMLSASDENIRKTLWTGVPTLVGMKILSIQEVRSVKEHFLSLLEIKENVTTILGNLWDLALKLIGLGIFTNEDQESFLNFLSHPDENVRIRAWRGGGAGAFENDLTLFKSGIVKQEFLRQKGIIKYLFSLLRSSNPKVKNDAWSLITSNNYNWSDWSFPFWRNNFIKYGIITSEDQESFLKLLSDPDEKARIEAWERIDYLIESQIISLEEVKKLKKLYLLPLLESSDYNVRYYGCIATEYITNEIITPEEKNLVRESFLSLIKRSDDETMDRCWKSIPNLIRRKTISLEQIIPYKEQYKEKVFTRLTHRLKSSDFETVHDSRILLVDFLRIGLFTYEDYKRLLDNPDETVRRNALECLDSVISRDNIQDIIPLDKLKEIKDLLLSSVKNSNKDPIFYLFRITIDGGTERVLYYSPGCKLIDLGIITSEDQESFLKLLSDPDEKVRSLIWNNVPYFVEKNIISIEKLSEVKDYLLDLLRNTSAVGPRGLTLDPIEKVDKWINLDPAVTFRYYNKVDGGPEEIPNQDYCQPKPWRDNGWHFYRTKEYYRAQKYFDKAIQLDPNDVDSWKGKSYNCLAIGYKNLKYHDVTDKYLDSLSCVDEAIKLQSDNVELLSLRAEVLHNLKKYDEAAMCLDKAIKLEPNNITYQIGRAYALLSSGKYDESFKSFNDIINLASNNADAWRGKALCLFQLEKYNDAEIALNEAIKLEPDNVLLLCIKARILDNLNKEDEATKFLDNAIKTYPDYAITWYYRACFNVMKGNIQQGLSDLEASVNIGEKIVRDWAKEEEDFISIRNNEHFKSIIK